MLQCPYKSCLDRYHDGELARDVSRDLERHLLVCEDCVQDLRAIRETSRALAQWQPQAMRPDELKRIHAGLDRQEDQSLYRFGVAMAAIAASVLIVSTAWLYDVPRPAVPVVSRIEQPEPGWERLAATLQVEPPVDSPQTGLADRDTADWMIVSVGERAEP